MIIGETRWQTRDHASTKEKKEETHRAELEVYGSAADVGGVQVSEHVGVGAMNEEVSEPLRVFEELVSGRVKKKTLHILTRESWKQVVELVEEWAVLGAGEVAQGGNHQVAQEDGSEGQEVVHLIATKTVEGNDEPRASHA